MRSWLVSAGRGAAPGAPLNVPPVLASNFILGGARSYARGEGTDTTAALETVLGGLEGGLSLTFSTGMAAAAAVFAQLKVGAVVVLPDDCYQGVVGLAMDGAQQGRWSVQRLPTDATARWCEACGTADLLWLESPSNPLLCVADLVRICAAPRKPHALLAVDNTFATPLNQQPLALGADVSVQSGTKFLGGHSDLLLGVATTRSAALKEGLDRARTLGGATPGAFEAFLALRGLRTLALRLSCAQANAAVLAPRLLSHPAVERVHYPGLPSHPTHAIARAQLAGFGSLLSFEVRGGAAGADAVCRALRLIQHATSLGAVESTLERRAAIPGQEHLPPGLLRLSVGVEEVEELWGDLTQALERPEASSDPSR